ncbi:NAD-dependent epimerase/dehydratase [Cellulomonas flavigena DSM 20109]|uniref:NAD-dependent epimerase/dehydratase n=1 Tax=Cellulomonas flavigena (strain ATCC 482 / DSM 20109 / BCRC 11376 / JCM 18109 / NBRC 3775 / NCIMB 8073 / NRS 134) TaxID=446466 RepID=D5UDL4_CELFN|nr:NAD-dependent epimerase/dehydratase family protein [Cellulomonas flavigena]ADG76470.1 NAD-dependent epimerase/dehydratase [Cellulomonas flavigena DSM 20109]
MTTLVTGAAGFIGTHVVQHLLDTGRDVVATDLVPADDATGLRGVIDDPRLTYVPGDLAGQLDALLPHVEQVWHLAANTDIPAGATDTGVDVRSTTGLTHQLLEALRRHPGRDLVLTSTSAVYGERTGSASETSGPLLPRSLYGAGKLAAEGLTSAYCATFGLRARIFRLGNVLGGGMRRGIVLDFLRKLGEDPRTLHVLGDGEQRKSYVLVDDVVAGMRHVTETTSGPEHPACDVYNLAAGGSVSTREVARLVAAELGLDGVDVVAEQGGLSWPGDQPVVELVVDKARATGWAPTCTAPGSVSESARRLLAEQAVTA